MNNSAKIESLEDADTKIRDVRSEVRKLEKKDELNIHEQNRLINCKYYLSKALNNLNQAISYLSNQ